jgi:hypothetical protein
MRKSFINLIDMIIFLKESDTHKVSAFLNRKSDEIGTLFFPSLTDERVVESIDGMVKIYLPSSVDDVYMVNGIICRSVLSVVQELKN